MEQAEPAKSGGPEGGGIARSDGRVKPDQVLVNDRPEKHPEGAYYLEWQE